MAWMHMQIAAGLGHDVHYFETTSSWPYHSVRQTCVNDFDYALTHLERVADGFGFGKRWAYRHSFRDKAWFGPPRPAAENLLAHADAVLNISGSTKPEELKVGRLVFIGTDPVPHGYAKGDPEIRAIVDEHHDFVSYGENIGTHASPVPRLPGVRHMRQPVLLALWEATAPAKEEFTTVCNWKQNDEIDFNGETYYWSKDREFVKFIHLPQRINLPLELAMGPSSLRPDVCRFLTSYDWRLTNTKPITMDPWSYHNYVRASRGGFTLAKNQNVRLRSGWFSERSACYLAAGRPVITQDTGFGTILPTGESLFSSSTTGEIPAACDATHSDYERHSRAAREKAAESFRAEIVLARLLDDLGS
jgi:hypothetical protein